MISHKGDSASGLFKLIFMLEFQGVHRMYKIRIRDIRLRGYYERGRYSG